MLYFCISVGTREGHPEALRSLTLFSDSCIHVYFIAVNESHKINYKSCVVNVVMSYLDNTNL